VFARIDLLTRPSRGGGYIELLLFHRQSLKIKIYDEKGHQRPHVHIDYGRAYHTASYAIDTGERLEGSLHRKYDDVVREWISEHQIRLNAIWAALKAGKNMEVMVAQLTAN
jgi:hypothetical protein